MAGLIAEAGAEVPGTLRTLPALVTRDTTIFDPAGGVASYRANQTIAGTGNYRFGFGNNNTYYTVGGVLQPESLATFALGTRYGYGWWFRPDDVPQVGSAYGVFQFGFPGATAQFFNLCLRNDMKLEIFDAGTSATTQGTASGTVSSSTLSVDTGYRFWADVDYGASTITIRIYVNRTLELIFTQSTTANLAASVQAFAPTTTGTAPNAAGNIDNIVAIADIVDSNDGGARWEAVVLLATVDGDGTDTDFTASAGSDFQCVDEAAPNDDTDYVEIDSTLAKAETFTMTDPAGSGSYTKPIGICPHIRHRNTDGGKWTNNGKIRLRAQGTIYSGVIITDPGGSYTPLNHLFIPNNLSPADITAMELGFQQAASGTHAGNWRITALQGTVTYIVPPVIHPGFMRAKPILKAPAPPVPFKRPFIGLFAAPVVTPTTRRRFAQVI